MATEAEKLNDLIAWIKEIDGEVEELKKRILRLEHAIHGVPHEKPAPKGKKQPPSARQPPPIPG